MITPRRGRRSEKEKRSTTGELANLTSKDANKLSEAVRVYLKKNKVYQEREFVKKIHVPSSSFEVVIGKEEKLLFHLENETLRRPPSSNNSRNKRKQGEEIQVTVKTKKGDDNDVFLIIPHVLNKSFSDAVFVRIDLEDKVASLEEFFLSTGLGRSAILFDSSSSTKEIHLVVMRVVEILSYHLGARKIRLLDKSFTRISERTGPKKFVYFNIPNRSAFLKVLNDDPDAFTYERYGFKVGKEKRKEYHSSSLALSHFLKGDTSPAIFLFNEEEMDTPLSDLVLGLYNSLKSEVKAIAAQRRAQTSSR
jgi:hypothetical protein